MGVLLALWVPKLRGPSGDMLVHHLATLTLATLGAGYGYLEHLAPFFFGLTELSSEVPRQPTALVMTFLVANILLTGLQFFWGFLIAKGVLKKIRGQKDD